MFAWLVGAGWAAFGVLVVVFIFYTLAHTWLVRPLITLVERSLGRDFFPYLDRIVAPRPASSLDTPEFWASIAKGARENHERELPALRALLDAEADQRMRELGFPTRRELDLIDEEFDEYERSLDRRSLD